MDEDESQKPGPSRPTKYVPPKAPDAALRKKTVSGVSVPSQQGRSVQPNWRRKTPNDAQHIQRHRGVSTSRQQDLSAERANKQIINERFPKLTRTLNKFQLPQRQRDATRDTSQGRNQRRSHNVFPNQRIRGEGVRRQYIHGYHSMGFVTLENIAKSNISEIFLNLHKHREGFMEILNSPIHRLDMFVLIFEVFSKVSQSPFEEIKSKLFLDSCNSNFMTYLRNYLTDLPYTTTPDKSKNNMYWNDQNGFWKNFITFCRDIVDISPATAVRTCRALIESVSITCLEHLNQRHAFILLEEDKLRLEELRNKLMNYADKREAKAQDNADDVSNNDSDMRPPEDFRELSVIPTREDLLDAQPFLRPNIVNGAYSDVEHYLDVQFRLLREDCFGPIRVGVGQYLADPTKRKYDHIRIFRNVKFAGPYITNLKVGTLVQIDIESNRNFKKINWAQSKRLLFGSLVLFTKNNFSEFIVATILDRDNILLSNGKLAVSIIDTSYGGYLSSGDEDAYTMIESEVYYEPYFHLMKALQGPSFSDHIPMQQYIVKVTPAADKPAYLTTDKKFIISDADESLSKEILLEKYYDRRHRERDRDLSDRNEDLFSNIHEIKFTVLQPDTWPTKEQLKLNESQYEAYKLALTHEFAVIQGPPGTGKTYVGLNIAKALLKNIDPGRQCLMLVICYTNHALDQFLVEISHITNDIVRIGGQSRNKDMDKFNLAALRKNEGVRRSHLNNYFMETKMNLIKSIEDFQDSLLLLDILNNGVINSDYQEAVTNIPEIQLLCEFYERFPSIKHPLIHWLFENYTEYYSDFNECLSEYSNLPIANNDNDYNNMRTDNVVMLDDDKDRESRLESSKKRMASFMVNDAKLALKKLVTQYLYADKKMNFKEKMSLELEIADLNSKINFYSEMIKQRSRDIHLNINRTTDFTRIVQQIRWRLYFMWIKPVIKATKAKISGFQKTVTPLATAYDETRMMMDMELIKNKKIKVLGLTTSGAARMRKLLLAVSPKIVIVEEAAEVLEQHIITSLTKDCQHLILIGDHQQLKPSASYIKLARQYNIEVSLFERMITNGIHSRRLNVQHRMRPEIAALISPHIYPDLENHPTVENFGNVPGVEKNVFFFTHEYREEANANNESNSRANHKEADLTLALANYLIQQGYKSDEVTILAAYSGQMFYMRKERQKYACLNDLKITVVDNYQGEESKIILLSLVRNNPENIIGFLGTENRICVALSRAKQGFFMFGNINMLKEKSELWRKIAATLEEQGSLGPVLSLKCQVHPEQITHVTTAEDFDNVPEGGCLRKCNYQYKCGHHCLLYCHAYDREHVKTKCPEKCERILCDLGHVCPLKCHEDCGECKVLVQKTLPCGHEMKVYCHRAPEDPKNECLTKVDVVLPKCGHKVQKNCHLNIEKVKCTEKCKQRLENCGHACERLCHVNYPGHKDYVCVKACTKKKKGCMAELEDDLGPHQCKKECYQACDDCNVQVFKKRSNCKHVARVACCVNIDDTPCNKNCARKMACGHFCRKKCSEQCGDCKTNVTKVIPDCNHEIKVECQKVVSRKDCSEKCKNTLSCGHPCMDVCSAKCDESNCKKLLEIEVDSPCGHKVKLPCNVYRALINGNVQPKKLLEYCKSPCGVELACKHICSGSCSQCYQGRLHAPCKQTCHQTNICGHQCLEPCNQICPPCNAVCEVQCQHSRCGRMCGEPCVECKEKCSRACPHGACSRLCSEPCSRAACGAACARALACGHRCRGVCGEPCPPVCKACRPGDFPTDFLGDEYTDTDKFILLQDCGHVLELENMDNLMMGDQENIQIRRCPFCRKPIINTNRYKDLVNKMIKNDINPIKEKVYGKNTEIEKKLTELKAKVKLTYLKVVREHAGLRSTFENLMSFMQTRKKMFLLQVEMFLIYYDAMEMIAECWKAFHNTKSTILVEEMEAQVTMILKALKIDIKSKVPIKISEQQQKDIGNEIKRLNAIVQLVKLLQSGEHLKNDPKAKIHIEVAKDRVLTLSVFDEDKAVEALKVLQTTIKSSGVVSKLEREMIVKAVGLKAGHWYKCPNGHFYCIDRCGGATEVSKCPDCGAAIGGTNHALLRDNAHAPEMDGSRFAAYSEEANNMANFQIFFD